MKKIIIHMLLNSEEEAVYEQIKEILKKQAALKMQDLSFSPMRPYAKIADYAELAISLKIQEDQLEDLKSFLASYWQGEDEEDIETDQIMADVFDPHVYYMNLQVL
ncbi:MAG: hypothetical protein ACLRVU_12465 [Beduini sp.]|uniref:hypothetical protein n=1 Tax=Beduini sp. TaxID=1922300 RepID=UPI0039A07094